ncbi:FAD-binding oxidoreductase [Phytoactinopolyspora mesophila]|uniref:FAD-binding protein n=1 Tax=Phytoactinopolyspora mesophila TaxID=2650750 RepID=A0A7K3M1B7_9ACTN|nr:FAD-binding protein [Phytoactinopolyspora mesophila]NDL56837.1 FAD-binding protein [Phytoactinopolyspora mesophila]
MTTSIDHASPALAQLRAEFDGQVIGADHPDYDEARTVISGLVDRRPAMIVRPRDAAQVARVVAVAAESGLELAVRGGGHSAAGHGVSEGGLVLDLRDMRAFDIDVEQRTASAQAGLTAGEYTALAGEHGLATGFGDTASVGIGGITLGGGVGFLSRRFGLTIDDLLAAEVVTADGQILEVDAAHHPDLFWAIRGGGGNFGVVTRFTFRVHEVSDVVGGMLILPVTPEIIVSAIAAADAAPEQLSGMFNVMTAPPMPFVPEEYHGKPVMMALLCYAGGAEEGERAMAPFRELATPLADMIKPMTYPELFPPDPPHRPVAAGRTLFVDGVDLDAAKLIMDRLHASTAAMTVAQFRVLGGAVARVPSDATAFAHRDRRVMAMVAAMFQDPVELPVYEAWVSEFAAELSDGSPGAYVNFVGDEGAARVRDAYPGTTWDRLREVKKRYDPGNLFRLNQNIPPAE